MLYTAQPLVCLLRYRSCSDTHILTAFTIHPTYLYCACPADTSVMYTSTAGQHCYHDNDGAAKCYVWHV